MDIAKQNIDILLRFYLGIFTIDRDLWKLDKVRLLARSGTMGGDDKRKIYKFVGIFSVPVDSCDIIPTDNEMVEVKNQAMSKLKDFAGADVLVKFRWKKWSDNKDKELLKRFTYFCELSSESIRSFMVVDGKLRVQAEMSGIFYG